MNVFFAVAAVMATIAAAAVALPLLRNRPTRMSGAIAAVVVVVAAAGLYPLWSNWNWHPPAQVQSAQARAAGPDVNAMVGALEQRLRDQPDDLKGWLMLGRSCVVLQRWDDAIAAYGHARRLDPGDVDATLGLGEAMSLRAGSEITPAAAQLFEQALAQAPDNPKALLYGGFAALVRGDRTAARSRWQALKGLHPPAQIERVLDAQMAELGPAGSSAATGAPGVAAARTGAASADTNPLSGAPASAEVTVNIRIAPTLKSRVPSDTPLFVFARDPGSRGPPLAAKRLTSSAVGSQIHLSSADSMLPGRVLVSGQRVSITARVSFSGQPTPAAGDLYGELTYDVGRDGVRNLVIDRVAE